MNISRIADTVRTAVMWKPWFRGILVDEHPRPSLKIVVAAKTDTLAARSAIHPYSSMYGLRTKVAVLNDKPETPSTVRPAHVLPYTCLGFEIDLQSKGNQRDGRLVYIPTTQEELRSLTRTLRDVFCESLNHEIVVAVATGGVPLLHYLIARWCRHKFDCEWPQTTAHYEACRARFKLLFGLRTGDEGSRDTGVAALKEILQGAAEARVMIVDSTFRHTGIHTIAGVARDAIKSATPKQITIAAVVDRSRNDGDPTPLDSTENLECPLHIHWFEADRILTEDIAEAIGYRKVSRKRVIEPQGSEGILMVQHDENNGLVFLLGTLANAIHGLLDSPGSWLRRQPQGRNVIDNQLRELFKTCRRPRDHAEILQRFIKAEINAFDFGVALRNATKTRLGVLHMDADPHATYPLLDKILEEEAKLAKEIAGNIAPES